MAQTTKEQKKKEKQLKLKKQENLKSKKKSSKFFLNLAFCFVKYFLSLTFSTLPSYFLGHFYPPLRNGETHRETDRETESSTYRAAMLQLKRKFEKEKFLQKLSKLDLFSKISNSGICILSGWDSINACVRPSVRPSVCNPLISELTH